MREELEKEGAIQLIVGLGNPGREYASTRHNAGAWFIEMLAERTHESLRAEAKFAGLFGKSVLNHEEYRLLIPTTYMNHSGQAVNAVAHFYRLNPENILVVHDDLDLTVGTVRFKQGGGDGGHNGLKDISAHLNSKNYWRLRIGIGHPGQRHLVHDYVLSRPSKHEEKQIRFSLETAIDFLPEFSSGNRQKAIQAVHS